MGDMTEAFSELNSIRKRERRARIDEAIAHESAVAEAAGPGRTVGRKQDGVWLVYQEDKVVVQWWPSSRKWQDTATGKVWNGGIMDFCEWLRSTQ